MLKRWVIWLLQQIGRPQTPQPTTYPHPPYPRGLAAAIIPAHNEEALIERTLRSVLLVFRARDVYIYCDRCTDGTAAIARRLLPERNVIEGVQQMGKSRGIELLIHQYIIPRGYSYLSVIDADTMIQPDYLEHVLPALEQKGVVCAVGQVKSRWYPKNLISVYRTYIYALWQTLYKRLQSWTNSVTIASGCSSTWRTSALAQIQFDHELSTEDFELTIQAHRRRLGKIVYVSSAVVWTQDPFTFKTYRKQMLRWVRAWWEVVRKHHLGLRWFHFRHGRPVGISAIDIMTAFMTLEIVTYIVLLASLLLDPLLLVHPIHTSIIFFQIRSRESVLVLLFFQYGALLIPAALAAFFSRRLLVLVYAPAFLLLVYLDIWITLVAVVSTARHLYRTSPAAPGALPVSVWQSPDRRADSVSIAGAVDR